MATTKRDRKYEDYEDGAPRRKRRNKGGKRLQAASRHERRAFNWKEHR